MSIGIIDADLIGRKQHRFPNLASMKISGYYKAQGYNVQLLTTYDDIKQFDKVYISKVFTDTYVDQYILTLPNVIYGGTGFYYDKAQFLPDYIEHHMPDYHLYDQWVQQQIQQGKNKKNYQYYTDWSIGFTTRYCFRKCGFCVNKNYDHVELWSPLEEFVDNNRKYICLLDDNMLGHPQWKDILTHLQAKNKPFQYKQGLDERLLTPEKVGMLFFNSKYKGDYIFAFDNIADKNIIENKLQLIRSMYKNKGQNIKFYVFCAFDRDDKWDIDFWKQDIIDVFERVRILMTYNCLPYIMRYKEYENSPFKGMYVNLASWCNQPNFFKKKSFREWCIADDIRKGGNSATIRYYNEFVSLYPEVANEYFDMKFDFICKLI